AGPGAVAVPGQGRLERGDARPGAPRDADLVLVEEVVAVRRVDEPRVELRVDPRPRREDVIAPVDVLVDDPPSGAVDRHEAEVDVLPLRGDAPRPESPEGVLGPRQV